MGTLAVRRIWKMGKARGVTLPETWLRWMQERSGLRVERVWVETTEDRLIIYPCYDENKKPHSVGYDEAGDVRAP